MFVLTSSLRKPVSISWHFGAEGDIFGKKKRRFFDQAMRKTGIILQTSKDPSKGRNVAWLTSERFFNKSCDAIMNEKLYL